MSKDTKTPAPITDAERRKRRDAVNFARASVGLKRFKPSTECEALAEHYTNREIEISEVIETINEQARLLPR